MSTRTSGRGGLRAWSVDSTLAYLTRPVLPALRRIPMRRRGRREHRPEDILLPEGYVAEVVATGLNAPVHCAFDGDGRPHVTECGYKIDAPPRILRIDPATGEHSVVLEIPEERWIRTGAVTGCCWHDGRLYFVNTDTLSRLGTDGSIEDLVTGLPGRGDHQANHPVVGPDGRIYFGMGSATNTGVVGADNFAFEWLRDFPEVHDVPGADVTLTGANFEDRDVRGSVTDRVRTGAYVPFGTETRPGQVIPGSVKCSGSVLRYDPAADELQLVAWGLRNPFGLAFHPDGRLFATEHGIDERGVRQIVGDLDDLYEVREGAWYGWPDFASGIRLDDPRWGDEGHGREPLLAEHPDANPPKPVTTFPAHSATNGLDVCRHAAFGFEGHAFVALFGDVTPVAAKVATPTGFKVVRVDLEGGAIVDFAVNKIVGPASKLPHGGFERPSHCAFGPDGALYVTDFGEVEIAPERGGIRVQAQSGTLWRIRRTEGPRGDRPPRPREVPLNALIGGLAALGAIAPVAGLAYWLGRRALGRGRAEGAARARRSLR